MAQLFATVPTGWPLSMMPGLAAMPKVAGMSGAGLT